MSELQIVSPGLGRPPGRINLTDRQIKYLAARAEGKSKKEAVRIAGYNEHTSSSGLERSPALRQALLSAMEAQGLTGEYLARKIMIGTETKKTHFFAQDGIVKDSREVPDNEIQHKYVRTALEVRGDLIKEEGTKMQLNVGIIEMPKICKSEDEWNHTVNIDVK